MFRAWGQTAVAAWICAALFASPILAAIECRQCCQLGATDQDAANCPLQARRQASLPTCCQKHAAPKPLQQRDTCPLCPKCEAKRPSLAVVLSDSAWKRPVLTEFAVPFRIVNDLAIGPRSRDGGREIVDCAAPPPRVLFCTWRE